MFSRVQKRSCNKDRNIKEMVKEFLLNPMKFITKGKKRIFHCCLAVLFLPEAEKIRPGVFRVASFTGDHLYLVSICRATERDAGFISFSLGPGSRQWSDGTVTATYWLLPQPTSGVLFLACP